MICAMRGMLSVADTNMGFRYIRTTLKFCGYDYQQKWIRLCMQIRTGMM
jgi:hypothetical protein